MEKKESRDEKTKKLYRQSQIADTLRYTSIEADFLVERRRPTGLTPSEELETLEQRKLSLLEALNWLRSRPSASTVPIELLEVQNANAKLRLQTSQMGELIEKIELTLEKQDDERIYLYQELQKLRLEALHKRDMEKAEKLRVDMNALENMYKELRVPWHKNWPHNADGSKPAPYQEFQGEFGFWLDYVQDIIQAHDLTRGMLDEEHSKMHPEFYAIKSVYDKNVRNLKDLEKTFTEICNVRKRQLESFAGMLVTRIRRERQNQRNLVEKCERKLAERITRYENAQKLRDRIDTIAAHVLKRIRERFASDLSEMQYFDKKLSRLRYRPIGKSLIPSSMKTYITQLKKINTSSMSHQLEKLQSDVQRLRRQSQELLSDKRKLRDRLSTLEKKPKRSLAYELPDLDNEQWKLVFNAICTE